MGMLKLPQDQPMQASTSAKAPLGDRIETTLHGGFHETPIFAWTDATEMDNLRLAHNIIVKLGGA